MNVATGNSSDLSGKRAPQRLPAPSSGFSVLGLMFAVLGISTFSLNAQSPASSPPSPGTPAQSVTRMRTPEPMAFFTLPTANTLNPPE